MFGLIAQEAVWLSIDGNVFVPRQRPVAFVAAEVFKMPDLVLGPSVLHGKDQLVAGSTAGNFGFGGVVTGTVHMPGFVIVEQIHENLLEIC